MTGADLAGRPADPDAPVRRVVVVRHGQTGHNAAGIWQGRLDTELSELGREQARRAAPALAALRPGLLLSSDQRRAADTADVLAAASGLPVRLDARLREVHVGRWQGMSRAEAARLHPDDTAALLAGHDVAHGVDGERVRDVVARVAPVWAELVAELAPAGTALVVTHGVTARALVAGAVGLDVAALRRSVLGLANAHWAVLAEDGGAWRLESWNVGVGSPDLGLGVAAG